MDWTSLLFHCFMQTVHKSIKFPSDHKETNFSQNRFKAISCTISYMCKHIICLTQCNHSLQDRTVCPGNPIYSRPAG